MAADRKVEHVQFDPGSAVSPHLCPDARFVFIKGCGKHLVNPPLFRIVEVECRDRFWIKQRHACVVTANHRIVLNRPFEVVQQRLDDKEAPCQDIDQGASSRSPAATGEVILLPVDRQVITELAGDDLGGDARVVLIAFDEAGRPLGRYDAL